MTLRLFLLIPLFTLGIITTACAKSAPHTVKKSTPQGDFVADTRKPKDVCSKMLRSDPSLKSCTLLTARASRTKSDCVSGMSPAGCFACSFRCP